MFLAQQARQLVGACAAGNLTLAKRVALAFYHPNCSPLALAMSGSMSRHAMPSGGPGRCTMRMNEHIHFHSRRGGAGRGAWI
jgi:hypothetical protein